MSGAASSRNVVLAALAANSLVTVTKFAAGLWTGSSAMLSEAVHSLVDTGNEVLLLYGQHRAARPADAQHPLGYGRELYFWSFIVALSIFAIGSVLSVYEGVEQMLHPEPLAHLYVNYAVLGVAFVLDGWSWIIAFRSFRETKGSLGWFEAVRRSKDPPGFMILFEDSADLIGLVIAFLGNLGGALLHRPELDGLASIGIGVLLGGVAAILGRETKRLLIGESADPDLVEAILRTAREGRGVVGARVLFSVQLSPDDVVVSLAVDYADEMTVRELEGEIPALERRIAGAHPEINRVVITVAGLSEAERSGRSGGIRTHDPLSPRQVR